MTDRASQRPKAWLVCLMALALAIAWPQASAFAQQGQPIVAAQTGLRTERLSIATPKGVRTFRVEIADTPRSREIGMMWRTQVPVGTGMLFNFKTPQQAYFWMENTLVGLDLIFIRSDGTIANIAANATPLSRQAIPSNGNILAVLEIGAGQAQKLGLAAGQVVRHPIFAGTKR